MKPREFCPDLHIPPDAVTQKLAFLGISGSGKTYGAGRFVEWLSESGAQVVVIDTIGNWWGLRLSANGKDPGLSIPVLGGIKGDVPLESTAGGQVAELVAESRSSMVVDVSDFTGGELRRFVTEFATRLLRAKKAAPSPVMIVWEECQDIVPQRVMGESAQMVGAVEKLIKKGRNYGVGTILISQRPQAVNKDVLNQVETIFAFRTSGSQERKALQDWIVHQSIDVGELLGKLPSLKTGTAFCWSPQWLKVLRQITVSKKTTYDASSTPEFGGGERAREIAPIDLEAFKKKMSATIERAKESDPALLKKRIKDLEAQIRNTKIERVEVPALSKENITAVEKVIAKLDQQRDAMAQTQQTLITTAGLLRDELRKASGAKPPREPAIVHRRLSTEEKTETAKAIFGRERGPGDLDGRGPTREGISRPQQRILDALASFEKTGFATTPRASLAVMADQSPRSSGYTNNLSALRSSGLIDYPSASAVRLTDAGRAAANGEAMDLRALHDAWRSKLSAPQWRIVSALIEEYPSDLSRVDAAQKAGQSPSSSGYTNNLSALRSLGLLDYPSAGSVVATDLICPAGL